MKIDQQGVHFVDLVVFYLGRMRSDFGAVAGRIHSRNTANCADEYFNLRFSGYGCIKIDQRGLHFVELSSSNWVQ